MLARTAIRRSARPHRHGDRVRLWLQQPDSLRAGVPRQVQCNSARVPPREDRYRLTEVAHEYPAELTLYIDGERLGAAGRATHRVVNPATGATLRELPLATAADLDRALDTAARGYRLWRGRGAADRSRVLAKAAALLRERIDRIAAIATTEEGKPLVESKAEVMMAANLFDFYAGEVQRVY